LDFSNIYLNIIVLRKKFKIFDVFLKDVLIFFINILRIKQWFKGARVAPNNVVGTANPPASM